jgi:hypothetical protein
LSRFCKTRQYCSPCLLGLVWKLFVSSHTLGSKSIGGCKCKVQIISAQYRTNLINLYI